MTNTPNGAPAPDYGQNGGQQPVGQPDSKYGTTAYNPQQSFEQGRPEKAGSLRKVAILSLVISVIGSVLGLLLAQSDAYQQAMIEYFTGQGLSSEMAEQSVSGNVGGIIGSIAGLVITVALYALVIIGLSKDKNWARILGIVFAIISIVFAIVGTGIGALMGVPMMAGGILGVIVLLWSLLQIVVDVYWLVLAFNGRVAAWFKGQR